MPMAGARALQTHRQSDDLGHGNVFTAGASIDYAELNFFSGAQVGVINSQLFVQPSNLIVDTPESSPFGGQPGEPEGRQQGFRRLLYRHI